jgi:DNA-binding response OmpR family regulator
VVEDEAVMRDALCAILEDEGYTVTTARDGLEAVSVARAEPPKLILLDWRLPGQNGGAVAEQIRIFQPEARFVVVTADGNAAARAAEISTRWYLHKPFEIDDLMRMVSAAIAS